MKFHFVQLNRRVVGELLCGRSIAMCRRVRENDRLGNEQKNPNLSPEGHLPLLFPHEHFTLRERASLLKVKGGNSGREQKRPHYSAHKTLWLFRSMKI